MSSTTMSLKELWAQKEFSALAGDWVDVQEDPLTRFLLRYDEFETGGELTDGEGKRIKMGKDSEPLRSGKGRALNVSESSAGMPRAARLTPVHTLCGDGRRKGP